MRKLGNSKTGM